MSFLGVLSLTTLGIAGCDASEPDPADTPSTPATSFHSVRAVVNCLNSIGLKLDVEGQPAYFSVRYPNKQLFIVGVGEMGEKQRDPFDRVYTSCGIDLENGSPVPGLKERFEQVFPGHPVATAIRLRKDGTLHIRTEDRYMFYLTARELDPSATVNAFLGILASGQPLAEAYFAAIRMRQEIRGEWRDSRRFGLDTFWYYVAPVDTVHVDLTAFPLRVTYFADRVELAELSAGEAAELEVRLQVGFDGVPDVLRNMDGVVLHPGQARGFSFLYDQFVPYNADIDVFVNRKMAADRSVPLGEIRSGVDLFSMFGPPATCPPGTGLFQTATRRSPILDRILQLRGETFPPADDRFPDWVEEDFYRRFPHRRP